MAKSLSDRIAERMSARKPTGAGKNRAEFLAMRNDVKKAMDDGWPVKVIWETLRDEGKISFGYDAFIGYVNERGQPVVLCFYFHPWEFIDIPESYTYGEGTVVPHPFIIKNCGQYAVEQLGRLLDSLAERGARFTTPRDLAASWD